MRTTTAGKLLAYLLFAAAVVFGAVWVRGEFRDLRHEVDGLKSRLRPAPPSLAPPPAGPPPNVCAPAFHPVAA